MNKRLVAESRGDFLVPKHFADLVNPEDVIGLDEKMQDALEILKIGLEHPLYWESWNHVKQRLVVDDPYLGPSFVLQDINGVWLFQINTGD